MGSKNANKKDLKDKRRKVKDNLSSKHSAPSDGKVISDPRYAKAHTDPRFREAPKRETKVGIDSRFNRMFTHKSFLPSSAPVDKRGKPKNKPTSQLGSMRHYYKIDEKETEQSSDEEEELVKANQLKPESDKGSEFEETSESESSAESEEASESESATDTDEGEDEVVYEEEASDVQEDIAEIEKETHRLAVVNMDWRFVKAVDLYALLSSFLPPNGLIKSVTIYPSEFGLQRMKEEEIHGPIGLFDDENDEDNSNDDIDNEKLRAYEKSRMRFFYIFFLLFTLIFIISLLPRYYFAVVECNSIATADYIYKECDGVEFMQTSNALDLRFIPDDMEVKHPPRDVATEVPANYECKDFYSRALQHSEVTLTWEDEEPLRSKILNRNLNDEQLAQMELKELLNSDDSDSDDSKDNNSETDDQPDKIEKKRAKYRALLQSGDDSDGGGEHDNGHDMEVTFNTDLEDLSKHILEKKDKKSETVWDAYLRKKREKKKARKNKAKYSSDDDSDDTDQEATEEADDFFIEEPAVKKRKKAQSTDEEHKPQDKVSKEELELLLADDKGTDTGLKGYNLKFKKGKGKRRENAFDEEKIPSNAFDDPHIVSKYSKHLLAFIAVSILFTRSSICKHLIGQKMAKSGNRRKINVKVGLMMNDGLALFNNSAMWKTNKLKLMKFSAKLNRIML
ncbi:uncharacterized protein HKW66_Vig0036490 [Vigna angularis]|uniref:ESF1 RRM domain-containing protein n=1 Tax=Phaseolus angularis TaxID=3914 RepID=A0A8T0L9R6_PHAAN|nr:uncharacterized protein HKW66_Vig0036490 [Vigna angularis]